MGVQNLCSSSAVVSSSPKEATKEAAKEEDDDEDLFGDDDDEPPAETKGPSRAEQMAAAKAEKDKKKKVEKSQVVYDVKPWEADQNLKELYAKIKREVVLDGLVWAEGYRLAPVAFGINKLVVSCIIEDDKVGLNDISDAIEAFEEDVQSVDLITMSRCS